MPNNSRWGRFLLGRILVHAFLGGMTCALIGALLISASGASVGCVLDYGATSRIGSSMLGLGTMIGAGAGGQLALLVGIITFAAIGFFSPARRSYLPLRSILFKSIAAMGLATLAIMASFFILAEVLSWAFHISLSQSVNEGTELILFGAPIVMCCGLILGAVNGLQQAKSNTTLRGNDK